MSLTLRQTVLEDRTEEYWKYRQKHKHDHDCYVDELLGRELAHAGKNLLDDGTPRLRRLDECVHTLALTVGESFEPLLQVTCVLRPKRVVLILNDFYSGTPGIDHGETLKRLMKRLAQVTDIPDDLRPNLTDNDFDPIVLAADTPTQVFRALRNAMQDPEAQPPEGYVNAVDITGAKKSMVVGAFLYAAHSGLPITYVDFDRYSSEWGKPYGYTCKIGQLADPYEVFGLRNWERVRQLYDRHNFRDAIGLIEGIPDQQEIGILEVMSRNLEGNQERSKLYDTGDQEKVGQLLDVLRMYEAWDSGDFQGALQLVHGLPKQVAPSVVTTLGNSWPLVTDEENVHWPIEIYIDAEKLTIYACDELKRIERLIQYRQDFRSAFLRAGGLSEVLMTARIVALIQDSSVKNAFLDALSQRTPTAEKMFKSLLQPVGASIALSDLGLRNAPKTSVTIGNRMIDWWQHTQHFADATGWQTFLDRRNVLTHRYVAVSEALAQDALRFTTANLEDFTGKSLESLEVTAHAAEWKELCRLLELDFLPPNLLT